ncbi:MAG: hypothetical protein D4S02_03975 [Rhodocyclaceae bacterium]|nr:MAG: hypothetical protein D4S02_03975 [Rhodocyclaceae bacterium]
MMGRQRQYESDAEKMKAYRGRKSAALAETLVKASVPQVVEKIVEVHRVAEKVVNVPAETRSKTSKPRHPKVTSSQRERVMVRRFGDKAEGAVLAKRLMVNAKKAVSAIVQIREVLHILPFEMREEMTADIDILEQASELLGSYVKALAGAGREADSSRQKRDIRLAREAEERLQATKEALFGDSPEPQAVVTMANDLLIFQKEIKAWASVHRDTTNALFDLGYEFELKQAVHSGHVMKLIDLIAKVRLHLLTRGSRHEGQGGPWWHGGWEDFIAWRGDLKPAKIGV